MGAEITSGAGLLACWELDGALGLMETALTYLRESRVGGNVHCAHGWRDVLETIVPRSWRAGVRRCFRGDAALAKLKVYEYLEERDFLYAIRLPSNDVLVYGLPC